MSGWELGALLAWGVVAGLDLVSVLQAMVSRPLVTGTVAGAIVGDPATGVLVGMVLELFALEVIPVGGSRYPDFGPAAVAGTAAAAHAPVAQIGPGIALGLLVAYVGDWSIVALRRWNTGRVRAAAQALDEGHLPTISRVQLSGLLGDSVRAGLLTAGGLALAIALRRWPLLDARAAHLLTAVVAGVGLATAATNSVRLVERGRGVWWFSMGLAGGIAWIALR
jgi:mannose/fructose/N-acetylgalactosamine-specific phosphotransferase system component IIC